MTADEQSIRALIERWHSATAVGDVDTVLTLMAEDVVFFVPGRPPVKGRSIFEAGLRSLLRTHSIHSTGQVQEVAVSGDLGYASTLLNVRILALSSGTETVRSGHTLSVFRKQQNGAWLLVRDANLLQPRSEV